MEKQVEWTSDDIKYMKEALKQAKKAEKIEKNLLMSKYPIARINHILA